MSISETEIGRFLTRTAAGKEYIVIQYQEFMDALTINNTRVEVPGSKSLRTIDGLHVNYVDQSSVKIVETKEIANIIRKLKKT
jgi:hypothetical protein